MLWVVASELTTCSGSPVISASPGGLYWEPFGSMAAGDFGVLKEYGPKSPLRYTTTFCRVPFSPGITACVIAGVVCTFAQLGSAAILICFILGGVPSSLIVPVTDPAVAASTGLPAEAAGASEVGWFPPPPQLISATARAAAV